MKMKTLTGGGTADSVGTAGTVQIHKVIIYTDGSGNAATLTMTDADGTNCLPASGLRVNGYGCSEGSGVFILDLSRPGPFSVTLTGTNAEGIVYYQDW